MGKHLRKIKIVQKQSAPVRPLHRLLRHKKREYQPSALQAAGWKPRGFASFTVLLYHHDRILSIGFAKIFSAFFANKSHGYQFYPQSVDGTAPLWAPCTFAPRSGTVHFGQKEKAIPDSVSSLSPAQTVINACSVLAHRTGSEQAFGTTYVSIGIIDKILCENPVEFLTGSCFHEISRQKSSTLLIYKSLVMRYNNLARRKQVFRRKSAAQVGLCGISIS